ncbi:hypothetical protein ECEC4448_3755, partial [Escherichia coli EC4448]
MISCHIRTALS